jgi:hypothetical protein
MIPRSHSLLHICRGLVALSAVLIGSAAGRAADVPAQLMQAFVNVSREDNHWAYTETTVVRPKSAKDKEDVLTVVRVDPSRPYAEQYTPLLVEGHQPTARELREYRQKGEKRAEELAQGATRGRGGRGGRQSDGDDEEFKALLDVDSIKVTAETATAITYHVPLRKGAKVQGVKLDKIEFDVRITKEEKPTIEHMEMHLLGAMRVMLVANVKSADFSVDFTRVDPKYPPVLSRVKGAAKVSVLLVARMSPAIDQTRTDYERVEPYDSRFKVQIGPLKVLNP